MRLNMIKTTGLLVLAGLLMPAGMLLGAETHQPAAVTSSSANWYDVEQASNKFNRINTLALKVRKDVGILQVEGNELNWQDQAARLARAKNQINTIGDNLEQLNQMKNKLLPWQQSLLNKITPSIHEMVYQTDAALNKLSAHENHTYLSLSQYPQNINQIYDHSNQVAQTINTVTQYARSEQKMAALKTLNSNKAGS